MSWITPSLCFFLLVCLFVRPGSTQAEALQPLNMSTVWKDDYQPGLSWEPPEDFSKSCYYNGTVKTGEKNPQSNPGVKTSPWFPNVIMEGGSLVWFITTHCGKEKSKPVHLNASYPDLVENFNCTLLLKNQAFCEWSPVKHHKTPSDFGFFYRLKKTMSTLKECSSYNFTNGEKTGCTLQGSDVDIIVVLFNGTLNKKLVRNTFERHLYRNVKPPPPTWDAKRNGTVLNISWKVPDINTPDDWSYEIKYTECKKEQTVSDIKKTFHKLPLTSGCQYSISVRAISRYGNTPWSRWKDFDYDDDNSADPWTYLVIIIPLVVASMAALICLCFQRNKDKIFPLVPEPRIPFGDFLDNNKSPITTLSTQDEEEENFKITLVVDPLFNKPDR